MPVTSMTMLHIEQRPWASGDEDGVKGLEKLKVDASEPFFYLMFMNWRSNCYI